MTSREIDPVAVWEHLLRFHKESTAVMDQSLRQAFGHSLEDYDVLHQVVTHDGPIRMGRLADRLLVANSSCHRLVGRLVDAGLLARRSGDDDRRAVLVDATPAGTRLHRRMAATHTRDIHRLVEPSIEELRVLVAPPGSASH